MNFELGEAFPFDWREEGLVVGGIYYRAQVVHLKLCASGAIAGIAFGVDWACHRWGGKVTMAREKAGPHQSRRNIEKASESLRRSPLSLPFDMCSHLVDQRSGQLLRRSLIILDKVVEARSLFALISRSPTRSP